MIGKSTTYLWPRTHHPPKVARFPDAILDTWRFVAGAQTAGAHTSGTIWSLMYAANWTIL